MVALVVRPLRSGEYVSALILGSAVVPTAVTALIQAGVQGQITPPRTMTRITYSTVK